MAGSTIVFSIPVGLALLQKRDHKYMALGAMAGLLAIPIGVLIANLLLWMLSPDIRDFVGTKGAGNHTLNMSLPQILLNLVPLALIMSVLALGLRLTPDLMIRLFIRFGRVMGILIKLILVACIVEYFTAATFDIGVFKWLLGSWEFEPVIADADQVKDIVREMGAITDDKITDATPLSFIVMLDEPGAMAIFSALFIAAPAFQLLLTNM